MEQPRQPKQRSPSPRSHPTKTTSLSLSVILLVFLAIAIAIFQTHHQAAPTAEADMALAKELESIAPGGYFPDSDTLHLPVDHLIEAQPYGEHAIRSFPLFFTKIPQNPHYKGLVIPEEADEETRRVACWYRLLFLAEEALNTTSYTDPSVLGGYVKEAGELEELGFDVRHVVARLKMPVYLRRDLLLAQQEIEVVKTKMEHEIAMFHHEILNLRQEADELWRRYEESAERYKEAADTQDQLPFLNEEVEELWRRYLEAANRQDQPTQETEELWRVYEAAVRRYQEALLGQGEPEELWRGYADAEWRCQEAEDRYKEAAKRYREAADRQDQRTSLLGQEAEELLRRYRDARSKYEEAMGRHKEVADRQYRRTPLLGQEAEELWRRYVDAERRYDQECENRLDRCSPEAIMEKFSWDLVAAQIKVAEKERLVQSLGQW